ncbi:adenylate cyclase [Rhizobium sp. BK251]|uniref:adenylate cyclase n=1 Tax=Rhizobium sp. BK251 TaxID=2512125 RepID=UPI001045AF8E|nr:adenylate cyclase [Rhizobium sp. BK251]TCL71349.1 TolB-like protein [Rhizobium sp. BK251]
MQTSMPERGDEVQPSTRPPPSPDEIRAQLSRILTSSEFPHAGRGAAFLTYVVQEALEGRAERLKGYSIAIEVFKRSDNFTQDDPVVRIEAGRLRRSLERYYLVAGQEDPIRIDIPKGGYAPSFAWNSLPSSEAIETPAIPLTGVARRDGWLPGRWILASLLVAIFGATALAYWLSERATQSGRPDEPTVVIAPFANLGDDPQAKLYTVGLTEELLTALPKFKEIKVFGRETSKSLTPDVDVARVRSELGARYLLTGGVRVSGNRVRVTARLLDTLDGEILWSQTYDDDMTTRELFTIQSDVASKVATAVAQPYGIIAQALTANPPPDDLGVYECTLRFYAYRAELSPETHEKARNCLENSAARYPAYATAWAMLSIIYLDEGRFRFNMRPDAQTPTERALVSARRAVELEPENVRALQALMTSLFFSQQPDEALKVGEHALATNPNDTEFLGEFGTRVAMSGQWQRGAALLDQALALDPGGAGYYYGTRALAAYMLNDNDSAVALIRRADLQKFPLFHVVAAGIYAEAGMIEEAGLEADTFMKMRPEFIHGIVKELKSRNIQPRDNARMIASLRKAGFPVPDEATVKAEISMPGESSGF